MIVVRVGRYLRTAGMSCSCLTVYQRLFLLPMSVHDLLTHAGSAGLWYCICAGLIVMDMTNWESCKSIKMSSIYLVSSEPPSVLDLHFCPTCIKASLNMDSLFFVCAHHPDKYNH